MFGSARRSQRNLPSIKKLPVWFVVLGALVLGYGWGQANRADPETVTVTKEVLVPGPTQPNTQIVAPTFPVACWNAAQILSAMHPSLNAIMGAGGRQQDIVVAAKTAIMAQDPRAMVRAQDSQNKLVSQISQARLELQGHYASLQAARDECRRALG